MRDVTTSSFTEGLLMDLNPLITPQTCLTDCLNGSIITYNGNEYSLQTDMGNVKIADAEIPNGFIPLGIKEYGGILYLALYNPEDNQCEIGSIPSPNYDVNPYDGQSNGIINVISDDYITGSDSTSYNFKQTFLKLFEFEQLTMNPGDEYVIGYKINSGLDIFDKVTNPIYTVELYAIDKDNKQHKLENLNVVKLTTKHPNIIQNDYKYFNSTISSILALKVKINDINWFETIAFEVNEGIKFIFYGKNKLNQENNSSDDLFIKGCKINYNNKDLYLSGGSNEESFKHEYLLTDSSLKEGDLINFNITPYDQHRYLTELSRKLTLKLGEKYNQTTGVNIFKYKYDSSNKSFRLDFDMPTLGMKSPYLYLEFYDIWSDYSVIYPIEDLNPLGLNTVFIDTTREELTNEYNSNVVGGVSKSVLIDYVFENQTGSNKIYQPVISKTIRKSQILRENNLYLVRIAAIDKDTITEEDFNTGIPVSKYVYKHKFLIVNEVYNEKYDQVNSSDITENIDFSKDSLNPSSISFSMQTDLVKEFETEKTPEIEDNLSLKTNFGGVDYFYNLIDNNSEILPQKIENYVETFKKEASYNLTNNLKKINNGYCKISLNDYSILSTTGELDIIESNTNIKSKCIVSKNLKKININLSTSRSIKGSMFREVSDKPIIGSTHTVFDKLLTIKENEENASMKLWGEGNRNFPKQLIKVDPKDHNNHNDQVSNGKGVNGPLLFDGFKKWGVDGGFLNGTLKYDGYWSTLTITENNHAINSDFLLTLRATDSTGVAVLYNDKKTMLSILKDLSVSKITDKPIQLYYYTNVQYDRISRTEAKGILELQVNTNLKIEQNIATDGHFSTSNSNSDLFIKLSNLLSSRGLSLDISDDNYFKLGNVDSSFKVITEVPSMTLEKGTSSQIKDRIVESKNDLLNNNPSLTKPVDIKNNTVYSASGKYTPVASKFSVSYSGDIPTFYYTPQNAKNATWVVSGNDGEAFKVDVAPFDVF